MKAAEKELERPEIIIANDVMGNPMNGGFVLVRVSDWSRMLLQKWWNAGTHLSLRNTWPQEQGSLMYLWRTDPDVSKRLYVLPDKISPHFHNTMSFLMRDGMVWKKGDCVGHIAGGFWVNKKALLHELIDLSRHTEDAGLKK